METDPTVLDMQKKYGSRASDACHWCRPLFLALGQKRSAAVLVGGAFSAVNFALMGQALRYRLSDNRKAATRRSLFSLLLRYALLAIPLVLAVRSDRFNFPATAVG